jgi:hypothetical protein
MWSFKQTCVRIILTVFVIIILADGGTVQAQTTTKTLTSVDFAAAWQAGRQFSLVNMSGSGTSCRSSQGGGNPRATSTWASTDGGAVQARCEHRGFQGNPLVNGWRVVSVNIIHECLVRVGSSLQALNPSECSFNVIQKPIVGTADIAFVVVNTVKAKAPANRRARTTWEIVIEGPAETSMWQLPAPLPPTLLDPPNGLTLAWSTFRDGPRRLMFSWRPAGEGTTPTGYDFLFCLPGASTCETYWSGGASETSISPLVTMSAHPTGEHTITFGGPSAGLFKVFQEVPPNTEFVQWRVRACAANRACGEPSEPRALRRGN